VDFSQVKHVLYKALGSRDALYLDTNAWSKMAKGGADPAAVADWLARTNSVITITRFSMGELAKDDRLAEKLAELIELLNVIFVDLGENDLSGQHWRLVPYEKIMSLKPADAGARHALVELLRSQQIRDTMNSIRSDASDWQRRFEQMIQQRRTWTWRDFNMRLEQFIRDTCLASGYSLNTKGMADNNVYVGVKLAFGVAYQRYFLNGQPFGPSDYVDYLHAADMPYFKTVVTERGLCTAIKEVQRRLPGLGPDEVHNLTWFEDIKQSA